MIDDHMPEYDIELTVDEVEFLTLRYLYQQKLLGRDVIPQNEIMEYLGVGFDEEDRESMLRINEHGISQLKSMERHYIN